MDYVYIHSNDLQSTLGKKKKKIMTFVCADYVHKNTNNAKQR